LLEEVNLSRPKQVIKSLCGSDEAETEQATTWSFSISICTKTFRGPCDSTECSDRVSSATILGRAEDALATVASSGSSASSVLSFALRPAREP